MSAHSCLSVVSVGLWPLCALAQEGTLTLEAALQRARERSVAVLAARSRVAEAQARLRGARALRDNPVLDGAFGRRPAGDLPADLDFGLSQTFELGGRRGARIAAAQAGVTREQASADDALRRALREVALAFLRGLAATDRIALHHAAVADAEEVMRIAERRHAAGDVAVLDVNLAAGALARTRSEQRAAEATRSQALGELRVLLALEPEAPLALTGELEPAGGPEIAALLEGAERRPDLQALEAEAREAEAEVKLGKGARWPDLAPAVRYERDEGREVLWGGVALSLPIWSRGQETLGVAQARSSRLRVEAAALRMAVRVEVQSAFEAYRHRAAALGELQTAAARLEENEGLARRSYEVGQIGLAELLLIRRETLEARVLLLERRREAAESEVELLAKAGVLR